MRTSLNGSSHTSLLGAALLLTGSLACTAPEPASRDSSPAADAWFVDVAASSGLDFVHHSGATGEHYFPETTGSGAALFDYDDDGDLDVYLVQGTALDASGVVPGPLVDRLYRNELIVEGRAGSLRFTDVTAESGLHATGYGLGAATGDYDGDGHVDLYVTNFSANQLWRNQGDGTFRDVTEASGTGGWRWSTSAAFLDYDGDGDLDLYVVNYVNFSFKNHKPCTSIQGNRDYCGPLSYEPVPDRLLENRGDGTFEDVSERGRVLVEYGNGLGLVTADFDDDGRLDVYVANDQMANLLWLNEGPDENGVVTFRDGALLAGAAYSVDGTAEASMGVDAGDFDNDGDLDLVLTHLTGQTNTLYVNEGGGFFSDVSLVSNVGPPSQAYTGFGTAFLDYDNDGWLDLLSVNGAVSAVEALELAGDPHPFHQPNQLLRNLGDATFAEVTARAGEVFELSEVSRGAAFGDLDNDGDLDVVITNVDGPVRLLVNQVGQKNHYLGVRLRTRDGRPDPLAVRTVLRRGGVPLAWRRTRADASYCSANDPRLLFGLGAEAGAVTLEVEWHDGTRERWSDLATDRYHTLTAGSGEAGVETGGEALP